MQISFSKFWTKQGQSNPDSQTMFTVQLQARNKHVTIMFLSSRSIFTSNSMWICYNNLIPLIINFQRLNIQEFLNNYYSFASGKIGFLLSPTSFNIYIYILTMSHTLIFVKLSLNICQLLNKLWALRPITLYFHSSVTNVLVLYVTYKWFPGNILICEFKSDDCFHIMLHPRNTTNAIPTFKELCVFYTLTKSLYLWWPELSHLWEM